MAVRFIHTADWQLGARFGSVADESKRAALRSARFDAIAGLAAAVGQSGAGFVVVAGDIFDTPTVSDDVVSRALSAIGKVPVPVYAIPGNHDHGGPGTVWGSPHFLAERDRLAPRFSPLLTREPVVQENVVIVPCPLLRRHTHGDPLVHVQEALSGGLPPDLPVIVLAHGSVRDFSGEADPGEGSMNFLDLGPLHPGLVDYIALGDWHGTKQVAPNAWYPGTPEPDRFPKNASYRSGRVLSVELGGRGGPPVVTPIETAVLQWRVLEFDFDGAGSIEGFERFLEEGLGSRVDRDAVRFVLTGSVSLEGDEALEAVLMRCAARCLRVDVRSRPAIVPSEEEIALLSGRVDDPLIAAVAAGLAADRSANPLDPVPLEALRQLFASVRGTTSKARPR